MVDKFGEAQPLKEGSSVCRYCYCEVKQWVSLTDEEVWQLSATPLFVNVWPHSAFAAIQAIEAKLRSRNGG
jgi:hypothetical protein